MEMEHESVTMEELAGNLWQAKRKEDEAKAARIELENLIASRVAREIGLPDDGSKTITAGNGLKITVKNSLSYDVNVDSLLQELGELAPVKLVPAVPAQYEFDKKAFEEMRGTPELFNKAVRFITTKPRKPSVTIKA